MHLKRTNVAAEQTHFSALVQGFTLGVRLGTFAKVLHATVVAVFQRLVHSQGRDTAVWSGHRFDATDLSLRHMMSASSQAPLP